MSFPASNVLDVVLEAANQDVIQEGIEAAAAFFGDLFSIVFADCFKGPQNGVLAGVFDVDFPDLPLLSQDTLERSISLSA